MLRQTKGWICAILVISVVLLCLPLPARLHIQGGARDAILPYQSFALLLRVHVAERLVMLSRAATAVERIRKLESDVAEMRYRNCDVVANRLIGEFNISPTCDGLAVRQALHPALVTQREAQWRFAQKNTPQ